MYAWHHTLGREPARKEPFTVGEGIVTMVQTKPDAMPSPHWSRVIQSSWAATVLSFFCSRIYATAILACGSMVLFSYVGYFSALWGGKITYIRIINPRS